MLSHVTNSRFEARRVVRADKVLKERGTDGGERRNAKTESAYEKYNDDLHQ